MTVFEKIKSNNIDELAEWIDEHFYFDDAPYWKWWDEHYCKKCVAEKSENDNSEFDWCELNGKCKFWCELNGKCKFFKEMDSIPGNKDIIKMWLESESK